MASGFSSIDPKAGNGKFKDEARLDEVISIHKFESGSDFADFRFLSTPILPLKQHWIKIRGGKDKREIKVSRWCIAFDPTNEKVPLEGVTCPYCQLSQGEDGACQTSVKYYANAIVRDLEANMPRAAIKQKLTSDEKKSGFIQMGSKTWTPVRVVGLPGSLAEKIQKIEKRNLHKNKEGEKVAFPITHPKNGIDLAINFDNSKAGGDKYSLDRGERTPLNEEQKGYLVWCLDASLLEKLGVKSQKEADEDFKRMDVIGGDVIEDDEEDDGDLDDKKSKKSSKKTSGKKPVKKTSKFDRDDEDDEEDDDEDDGDIAPKKKSSKLKSGKTKSSSKLKSSKTTGSKLKTSGTKLKSKRK